MTGCFLVCEAQTSRAALRRCTPEDDAAAENDPQTSQTLFLTLIRPYAGPQHMLLLRPGTYHSVVHDDGLVDALGEDHGPAAAAVGLGHAGDLQHQTRV